MTKLLRLLQLASPTLPVGAYSYSEGLETLVDKGVVTGKDSLHRWLENELNCGAIRVEATVMLRAYQSLIDDDLEALSHWNAWLSAARETSELRQQSWQMGRSLIRLALNLQPELASVVKVVGNPCNYAITFGIVAAHWQIDSEAAILAYLQSWASNLISAGVKLIPLGQTEGQQILFYLSQQLVQVTGQVLAMEDEQLASCSWGLSLASMAHQRQYTRLFRS